MPTMKFTNDEIGTLLNALRTEDGEWLRYKTFHGSAQNINSVSRILENVNALEDRVQEVYDNMTDEDDAESIDTQITEAEAKRRTAVAKMMIAEIDAVERAACGNAPTENTPAPRAGSGWHHQHGWLPSTLNKLEELKAFDDARSEGIAARRRISEQPGACHGTTDIKPGTWTTLPDDFGVDDLMFDITDPEDKIVIASGDTQTDGTMVGFYAYPTNADKSVNNAIWALITRNFSLVSERDIQLAEKVMRSDPSVLGRIRSSVEDLQKAYGDDGKFLVNIQVDGRTAEVKVDEKFLKVLHDLNRRF